MVRLGFSAVVAQSLLLRESMAALGGSELAWGVVLALWLAGMGIGSRCGVRWTRLTLARWFPVLQQVMLVVGVVMLRASPLLVGASTGERLTTFSTLGVWCCAVLPSAVVGGWAFPVLAEGCRQSSVAWAAEALGALFGGVSFSFVLASWGTAVSLSCCLGIILAWTVWQNSRLVAAVVLALGVLTAAPAAELLANLGWRWAQRPAPLGAWRETRQQRLELMRGEQLSLFADGRLRATYPDPFITVPRSHLLLLLHPQPRRVFVSGGLVDGAVESMLGHPVHTFRLFEEDPLLFELLPRWYGPSLARVLADDRVEVATTEVGRALKASDPWDLIILLTGNPTTVRHARLCSLELFQQCQRALSPGGLLVLQLDVSDTYLGGAAGRLLAVVCSTLRQVFDRVIAIPGERVLLVAGEESAVPLLTPELVRERWRTRQQADPTFAPELLTLLLDQTRAQELNRQLAQLVAPITTVSRPRVVLLASGLQEARAQPQFLALVRALEASSPILLVVVLVVAVLLVGAGALRRGGSGAGAAAILGFVSMSWWLLLVMMWQVTRGSVYAEIGGLNAAFMGGLAAGAIGAARWREPTSMLVRLFVAGVVLSMAVALELPQLLPQVLIPVALLLAGLATGAAFAGLARLVSAADTRRAAGLAFSADELGAGCAALVVGLVALPLVGTRATAVAVAVLQLAAVPMLWRSVATHRLRGG